MTNLQSCPLPPLLLIDSSHTTERSVSIGIVKSVRGRYAVIAMFASCVGIAIRSSSTEKPSSSYLHAIVQVLNDALDQVFALPELGEMVERREQLKFLEQPEDVDQTMISQLSCAIVLDAFFPLAESAEHLEVAACESILHPLLREYWIGDRRRSKLRASSVRTGRQSEHALAPSLLTGSSWAKLLTNWLKNSSSCKKRIPSGLDINASNSEHPSRTQRWFCCSIFRHGIC